MFRFAVTYLLSFSLAWTCFAQKKAKQSGLALPIMANRDFFILQKNNLYGLGDSGKFYNNMTTGDTIFHLGDYHFAVRNTGRYSIYNETGVAIEKRIIRLKEFGAFILIVDSLGTKIFSKKENRSSDYMDSIRSCGAYALLYKNNKQGLLRQDQAFDNIVLPQYEKAGPYYEGTLIIDKHKLGWRGSFSIPVEFDHIYKEQTNIMAAKNQQGIIYYNLLTKQKLNIAPEDSVVFYDHFYKRLRGKQESIFKLDTAIMIGETNTYQIHPFAFEEEHPAGDYMIAVKDSFCALFRNGKLLTEFSYKNVLPENAIYAPYFRIVQNGNVGVIDEKGNVLLKTLYSDVLRKENNRFIVQRGYKLGLCTQGDSVILPAKYRSIWFAGDGVHAFISLDGKSLGVYDCIQRQESVACKYDNIAITGPFIVARSGLRFDVYYNTELKFSGLADVQANNSTVKGYKDGKIFMGYVRKEQWEEYSYEIPSYKVISDNITTYYPFQNTILSDIEDVYDYSVGKWGRYSYPLHQWAYKPLAHSGDDPHHHRILSFGGDTLLSWNNMRFYSPKTLAPFETAWEEGSRFRWFDVNDHFYTSDNNSRESYRVSPICYKAPGKGNFINSYAAKTINFVFKNSYGKSIFTAGANVEIAGEGEIGLSDFIAQLSTNGNIHPHEITDYEKLIDPRRFVKFTNGSDHVLHQVSEGMRHFSIFTGFERLDKEHSYLLIPRSESKYGLLSDSGTYILKPVFESVKPLRERYSSIYVLGLKAYSFKLYDPADKQFSRSINGLLDAKDRLLLIRLNDSSEAVLNLKLDTLLVKHAKIKLLGDADYSVLDAEMIGVYRDKTLLFAVQADAVEKVNDMHFLLRSYKQNSLVDLKGSEIFSSSGTLKHLDLGCNYLLNDGKTRSLFNAEDKLIYTFQRSNFMLTAQQDLIVKEENSVSIFKKNQSTRLRIPGKFSKALENCLIVKNDKIKSVYTYDGTLIVPKANSVKVIDEEHLTYKIGRSIFFINVITKEKKKVKKLTLDSGEEDEDEAPDDTNVIVNTKAANRFSIIQNKGLYGLKINQKTELEPRYFLIQKLSDLFLVQDEMEYRLYDSASRKFLGTTSYQAVYPYKHQVMVLRDGKISYLDPSDLAVW